MNKNIRTWLILILFGGAIAVDAYFKLSDGIALRSFLLTLFCPLLLWVTMVLATLVPSKEAIIWRGAWITLAMGAVTVLGLWAWSDWHDWVANWPMVLVIVYLPVMLLLWFGYQKLEQRRK